jgi:NAD-dependent deacetylase
MFHVVSCCSDHAHADGEASRGAMLRGVLDEVRGWIDEAERILVLTGAGISTDSGIRDFRGPNGVWTKDPDAERRSQISYYVADPELRKSGWRRRLEHHPTYEPNPGHRALVELERRGKVHLLVTQNVDGLHLAAGTSPELLVEIHGTNRDVACLSCGERAPMERALERVRAGEEDPPCRSCGGILKAATISFGQDLVRADLLRAFAGAQSCDLVLAVGSTLGVVPAADLVPAAKQRGARVVILNAEPTQYDFIADAVIRGSISEVLPALCGEASAHP